MTEFTEQLQHCNIGLVLAPCLQEVVQVKPRDPIFYMAQWLYNYADSRVYFADKQNFIANCVQATKELQIARRERMERLKQRLSDAMDFKLQFGSAIDMPTPDPFSSEPASIPDFDTGAFSATDIHESNQKISSPVLQEFAPVLQKLTDITKHQKRMSVMIEKQRFIRKSQDTSFDSRRNSHEISFDAGLQIEVDDLESSFDKGLSSSFDKRLSSSFDKQLSSSYDKRMSSTYDKRMSFLTARSSNSGGYRGSFLSPLNLLSLSPVTSDTGSLSSNTNPRQKFPSKLGFNEIDDHTSLKPTTPAKVSDNKLAGPKKIASDDHISNYRYTITKKGILLKKAPRQRGDGFFDQKGQFYLRQTMNGREGHIDSDGAFYEIEKLRDKYKNEKSRFKVYIDDDGKQFKRLNSEKKDGYMDKYGNFLQKVERKGIAGYLDDIDKFHEVQRTNMEFDVKEWESCPSPSYGKYMDDSGFQLLRIHTSSKDGFYEHGKFYQKTNAYGREGYLDKTSIFREVLSSPDYVVLKDDLDQVVKRHRMGIETGFIDPSGQFYVIKFRNCEEGYVDFHGKFHRVRRSIIRNGQIEIPADYMDDLGNVIKAHRVGVQEGFINEAGVFFVKHISNDREGYLDQHGQFHEVNLLNRFGGSGTDDSEDSATRVKQTKSAKRALSICKKDDHPKEITCKWYYRGSPPVMICNHPLLGKLKSPHLDRIAVDNADLFWGNVDYCCNVHYDHEIYTVCLTDYDVTHEEEIPKLPEETVFKWT